MSVLMTLRVAGDPKAIEAIDQATFKTVVDRAKEMGGLISHHFYGGDNEVLVVDEWEDEASFHAFFEASPEIPEMMQAAGVTTEPEISFWRHLDTGDSVG
jgi:heme-degrading monooxygenase HmoA